MTNRIIFCASWLILPLALGTTSARAQTRAGAQGDHAKAASQVKTGAPFDLDWLPSPARTTGVGARTIGFRLVPPGGYAVAKAGALRPELMRRMKETRQQKQ